MKIALRASTSTVMDVNAQLFEVRSLDKEILRLRKKIKELQARRKKLQADVVDHMREKNSSEITYNGQTYRLEEKTLKTRKKEADKKRDVLAVISEHIDEDDDKEKLYSELIESLRGPEKIDYRLKSG